MPAPAATVPHPQAFGPGLPNINPVTGLSTDYLNHFSEALMALEMVRDMPECIDDLRVWQPKTYTEHFAGSRLSQREAIIQMYDAAPSSVREAFDALADALNTRLAEARDAAVHGRPADDLAAAIRPLIAEFATLISGGIERSQAAIDAMFPK